MDWGSVPVWVAVVISVAALVVAERSRRQAKRSADASVASAAAAARQLELTEAQAAATKLRPWRMEHRSGDTYQAVNESSQQLYGVQVVGAAIHRSTPARDVDAGSALDFAAYRSAGVGDLQITVTWHQRPDRSDEALRWSHPLPPRPPRH